MTARAVMEIAWGGMPPQTAGADGAYYHRWATEEFGAKSADALARIYKEYFAAPALRRAPGARRPATTGNVPRRYGDQHYHTEVRRLILDTLSEGQVIAMPSQSPKWTQPHVLPSVNAAERKTELADDIADCEEAQPRWDAVWNDALAAEQLVNPERRNYYQAQVLTMIAINRDSNQMLLDVARALQDDDSGQTNKAQVEINSALGALDAVQRAVSAAEYGKWKNWYRGDWLTGVYRTRELVQDYTNHLKDPLAKLPAPVAWSGWEAYFHIMEYEGDRSVDVH